MLKLAFTEDFDLVIMENNLAHWKLTKTSGGSWELVGYGGENLITVIVSGMQDGSEDILVIHKQCDSPIQTAQECLRLGYAAHLYNDVLNQLLAHVGGPSVTAGAV